MKMAMTKPLVGDKAPDFTLESDHGEKVTLSQLCKSSPVLLVFYPWDFTPVCTTQLCDYRDSLDRFSAFGLRVVGVSSNSTDSHRKFVKRYEFPFILLSDPGRRVAKRFGCSSKMMLGMVSRAVFIIGKDMNMLYRHVESTIVSRRTAEELISVLNDLKSAHQI